MKTQKKLRAILVDQDSFKSPQIDQVINRV